MSRSALRSLADHATRQAALQRSELDKLTEAGKGLPTVWVQSQEREIALWAQIAGEIAAYLDTPGPGEQLALAAGDVVWPEPDDPTTFLVEGSQP